MKLSHLKIHNYRSIRDLDLEVPAMLVLVGPNNHGKSNILRALEFGLTTSAKPGPDDFFHFRPEDDNQLWVELTFQQLTDQERTTFQKYLLSDGTICIRKTAKLDQTGGVEIFYNGYVDEPQEWWLRSSAYERLSDRSKIEQEAGNVSQLRQLLKGSGRITKGIIESFQRDYIAAHRAELALKRSLEETPLLGQKNVAGGVLPEFLLVPAVRDLSDEVKVKTSTFFGRLLQRAINLMAEDDPRLTAVREQLQQIAGTLNARSKESQERLSEIALLERTLESELKPWGVQVSIKVTPPELEKVFELGTELLLNDGLETAAERKGHGLQRAVIFALLRAWAGLLKQSAPSQGKSPRQASESVFFAIEEPELYLHPHAQRQLRDSLAEIAGTPDHQIFLSTHSTHFIDLLHYQRIAIIRKPTPERGTLARQCTRDLFAGSDDADRRRRFHMAYWVNPDRAEMFFADYVVLVEGETEKAVLPFLAKKLKCFDAKVTLIDCGSKNNMPLYVEVLNGFGIPYCVVHDRDGETDRMNERIRELVDRNLGSVEPLEPDFEGVAGIPLDAGRRKGKALAALEYFENMEAERIPCALAEVVRKVCRAMAGGARQ